VVELTRALQQQQDRAQAALREREALQQALARCEPAEVGAAGPWPGWCCWPAHLRWRCCWRRIGTVVFPARAPLQVEALRQELARAKRQASEAGFLREEVERHERLWREAEGRAAQLQVRASRWRLPAAEPARLPGARPCVGEQVPGG
jgi:multidrug efflux pump subunit AcrA (membrane-fusion protein)